MIVLGLDTSNYTTSIACFGETCKKCLQTASCQGWAAWASAERRTVLACSSAAGGLPYLI